ncbi:tumor necrosis factor receptor superfamily member 4-like [Sinocyclocheilus grahami]|uniref:tumor necrosis factor receptor superfamily member 4-like n=1 Tax=Sinocyclocheilus grahami TaxID=75366 RepID=UPI0007ACF01F|nr:PREDICTED: tumor necrosis factor receptor superfamily member 4-like [Sinocyclocheilus grahami]
MQAHLVQQVCHRQSYVTKKCEACPQNQYRSTSGTYFHCENCSKCKKGSNELNSCTSTSDTKCKCKKGFTPIDWIKEEICSCEKGSGIDETGICKKCEDGFFTYKENSICQKWRECINGIVTAGTGTSDAVCKHASKEVKEAPTKEGNEAPTKEVKEAPTKEGNEAPTKEVKEAPTKEVKEPPKAHITPFQATTISSTTTSRITDSSNNIQKNSLYSLWLVMLCAAIFLLAGLLYHKCKVTHCIHNHKKVDFRKESVCRKPVEESGEKCQSLLV